MELLGDLKLELGVVDSPDQFMNMDESGLGKEEEGHERIITLKGEKRPFRQQVRIKRQRLY